MLVALTLFLGLFLLFVTISSKKAVRFFLPAFPVIDVFAAPGLVWLSDHLILAKRKRSRHVKPDATSSPAGMLTYATHTKAYLLLIAGILLVAVTLVSQPRYLGQKVSLSTVLTLFIYRNSPKIWHKWDGFVAGRWEYLHPILFVQAIIALPHYPYYFTYYNPLLGGGRTAEGLIGVGRGEGLDLAAAYLNQKPGEAMNSDYLVFYQNQLQRQLPDLDLLVYYQKHYTPEHIVHLKGIDYALIYPVPLERRTDWEVTNIFGKLILYGYRQEHPQPDALNIRFIWENKGMLAKDGLWAALQRCKGEDRPTCRQPIIWHPCAPAPEFLEDAQQSGALVESVCKLNTGNLAPGIYSLHIGVGPSPDNLAVGYQPNSEDVVDLLIPFGELGVSVSDVELPSLISPGEALDVLATEVLSSETLPLHISYGNTVALIGYQVISPSPQTNHAATISLYWQALQDIPQPGNMAHDFQVRFDLIAPDGTLVSEATSSLLSLAQANDLWRSGQVLADPHQIPLPDHLQPGSYRLAVALIRADTDELVPVRDEATGMLTTDHIQLETTIVVQ
jgi:hypothetical protein